MYNINAKKTHLILGFCVSSPDLMVKKMIMTMIQVCYSLQVTVIKLIIISHDCVCMYVCMYVHDLICCCFSSGQ